MPFFTDKPASTEQIKTLRPEQEAVQNQALGRVSDLLSQTAPQKFNFAPIEQKAREDFQTKTVPSLAERFVGLGSGTHGSAFRGALGSQGAELDTNLAALGAEYGLRGQELQQGHLTNLLQLGLGRSFDNAREPGEASGIKKIGEKVIPIVAEKALDKGIDYLFGKSSSSASTTAGDIAGKVAAGGAAAATGGGFVNWVKSMFGGAPADVQKTIADTATASGQSSSAWQALPPALAITGGILLLNKLINKLDAQGKAEEAEQKRAELAKLQQYYDDKASGKFGPVIDWPKREQNEDTSTFLNRVIQSSNQRLSARQAELGVS